jgi:hypothetical protein
MEMLPRLKESYLTKEKPVDPEPVYRTLKESAGNRLLDSEDALLTQWAHVLDKQNTVA